MRADRLLAPSRSLQRVWEWADRTQTGDRAELPFVPPGDEWEQLDADADECVGELCSHFSKCYFFGKRDEAKYADLVVVNHALFFLDLAVGGGLLPAYDVVVLDEAHQCERWATEALTSALSGATIGRMLRKLRRVYDLPADFEHEFDDGVRGLESALARVPFDRYPLAANDDAWPALEPLRDDALSSRELAVRQRADRLEAPCGERGRGGTAAGPGAAFRARARVGDRSGGRRRAGDDRVGGARRGRRTLLRELRAARRRRFPARLAVRARAQRRAHERDARDPRIVRVRSPHAWH